MYFNEWYFQYHNQFYIKKWTLVTKCEWFVWFTFFMNCKNTIFISQLGAFEWLFLLENCVFFWSKWINSPKNWGRGDLLLKMVTLWPKYPENLWGISVGFRVFFPKHSKSAQKCIKMLKLYDVRLNHPNLGSGGNLKT